MRAKTITTDLEHIVAHELRVLREAVPAGTEGEKALAFLECFAAVSLRLMAKTNPSKVVDVAMTSEIRWRLDGREEIRCGS